MALDVERLKKEIPKSGPTYFKMTQDFQGKRPLGSPECFCIFLVYTPSTHSNHPPIYPLPIIHPSIHPLSHPFHIPGT